ALGVLIVHPERAFEQWPAMSDLPAHRTHPVYEIDTFNWSICVGCKPVARTRRHKCIGKSGFLQLLIFFRVGSVVQIALQKYKIGLFKIVFNCNDQLLDLAQTDLRVSGLSPERP